MNGNKPFQENLKKIAAWSPFTARVANHPKVAYFPYPDEANPDEALLVTMVIDQILVSSAAAADPEVADMLLSRGAVDTGVRVFGALDGGDEARRADEWLGDGNISIWQLDSTPGDQRYPDVAEAVWAVREEVLSAKGIDFGQVAPNHVLIPAGNFHICPWSPPEQHNGDPGELGAADSRVTVTVIDSGYQDGSLIRDRLSEVTYGRWFAEDPFTPGSYLWVDEPAANQIVDPLDQDRDGRLDALVAHANFVAGVVAQMCPRVSIEVVSHNGAFVNSDVSEWAIPTEASVARSLWNSRNSDVINVGFAFPTLPAVPPVNVVKKGPPSWALDLVLRSMSMSDPERPMIVAPAGNQNSATPQYPAAFHSSYSNVIGVGSVGPNGQPSSFSNHGPWVACWAKGENVVSTLINASALWETEDAEPPTYPGAGTHPPKDFRSGWASWSGTSFAAPKIAGAIACRCVETNLSPLVAWDDLSAGQLAPPEFDNMGVLIRDLPV